MADPNLELARRLYRESLSVMNMELTALLEFAEHFRGEQSTLRLASARNSIREELDDSRDLIGGN